MSLNPEQHSRAVSVSTTAQLTSIPDCSHRHTENLLMCSCQGFFFSYFSPSLNLQSSSWAVTQIHYQCSEPGMHHLCCNVQHQSKVTFFNARRKNGEVLAVEIVRKVLRFQSKELKKHARLKQSLHMWYKKNLRWVTQVTGFCNRIFCAKSKCKEHILCLQIGSCNSHIHIHSITFNYGQQVRCLEKSLAKRGKVSRRPSIQVWPSQLSVANSTKIQRSLAAFFLSSILYKGIKTIH